MISLLFVQGRDAGANVIQWFGHGAGFSHVDSILGDGRLLGARSDDVGGAPAGVQVRNPAYVQGAKTLRVYLQCHEAVTVRYYAFLRKQIGKPYDHEGIAGFIVGRNWQRDDAWFCSELVAAGLQASGYLPYKLASPSNRITPPDLVLVLSALTPITLP